MIEGLCRLHRREDQVRGGEGQEALGLWKVGLRIGGDGPGSDEGTVRRDAGAIPVPPSRIVARERETIVVVSFLEVPVAFAVAAPSRGEEDGLEDRVGDGIFGRVLIIVDRDRG
jgi:hypothetical protein